MRTFLKYLFVHLPEWSLGCVVLSFACSWGWLSWPGAVTLLLIWIVIDLAIYPLLREAYRAKGRTGVEALIGMTAEAEGPLDPSGFVALRGELWRARLADKGASVSPGAVVHVVAAEGLTLIVTPAEPPAPR